MDKATLPGTKEIMLQGGELEAIGFLMHDALFFGEKIDN
jgi:hypothetical protein